MDAQKHDRLIIMRIATTVSACALALLCVPSFANTVDIPTPSEIATWPAQMLLAAVAMASLFVAYKTWQHSLSCQEKASAALAQIAQSISEQVGETKRTNDLLAERPCFAEHIRKP